MTIRMLLLPTAALLSAAALAGEHGQMKSYAELDTDYDGRISPAEAQADEHVLKQFRQVDADGDGYLSTDEFAALTGKQK